jgi:hypothetical protein
MFSVTYYSVENISNNLLKKNAFENISLGLIRPKKSLSLPKMVLKNDYYEHY